MLISRILEAKLTNNLLCELFCSDQGLVAFVYGVIFDIVPELLIIVFQQGVHFVLLLLLF